MKKIGLGVLAVVLLAAAAGFLYRRPVQAPKNGGLHYLPLGDSYTIGQSVKPAERWPNQLAARLQAAGQSVEIVDNPAVTGYTAADLINQELPLLDTYHPDLVTVQIGVNDVVQGVPTSQFQERLEFIVQSIRARLPARGRLVLVTIPDYTITPAGANFGDPTTKRHMLAACNAVIEHVGQQQHVPVADVFALSQQASQRSDWLAGDGLHPSAAQYAAWTERIYAALPAVAPDH